ncbi:sensor histidine kinase [Actinoplanes sp. NPDC049265]|uniref:sensor histidine kinase n=1 Tax=Actinoplanes sp. NPDC049265 TaxID=3363902 RepID=UPI0037174993
MGRTLLRAAMTRRALLRAAGARRALLRAATTRRTLVRDAALAGVAVPFTAMLLWLTGRDGTPDTFAVQVLMAAQTALIVLRRVSPVWCVALMLVLQTAISAAAPHGTGLRGVGPAIAVYTGGTLLATRSAITLAVVTAVVEIGGYAALSVPPLRNPPLQLAQLLLHLALSLLVYVGAALLGSHLAMRRRYTEAVAARAAADADAHQARTEAVLSAERARTARELHDVAAHHLTSLIVQATLVERLLDRDPEAARGHAAAIREEGRNTLHNLRLIVGALRDGDAADPHLPDGSGLAMIDRLVAGGEGVLTVDGAPGRRDPAVELALYRVAQEALTNARDHAPGAPVTIALAYRESETTMEIHNGPPSARPVPRDRAHRGFGLIGMRERASLIGASLTAGPDTDGGWRVHLAVPHPRPGA